MVVTLSIVFSRARQPCMLPQITAIAVPSKGDPKVGYPFPMCVYVCVYIYIYIYTHTPIHISALLLLLIYIYIYAYIYIYIYTYVHIHTHTYMCIYIYIYIPGSPFGGKLMMLECFLAQHVVSHPCCRYTMLHRSCVMSLCYSMLHLYWSRIALGTWLRARSYWWGMKSENVMGIDQWNRSLQPQLGPQITNLGKSKIH